MRYILLLLILVATSGYGATHNITKAVAEAGGDYATLALAEAAWDVDLVGMDSSITLEITGTWADQGATTVDGATTDVDSYYIIYTSGDALHGGVWDGTNAYRIVSTAKGLVVTDDYVTVDGIQVTNTGSAAYQYTFEVNGAGIVIKNNIIWTQNTNETFAGGLLVFGGTVTSYNNIVYGASVANSVGLYASTSSPGEVVFYNNTVVDFYKSFKTESGDGVFINNMCYNHTTLCDGNPDEGTVSDYNATDSATTSYGSCGGCGGNDVVGISDPFENYAGKDFHLSAADAGGAEDGMDASAVVTDEDDIDGDARPQSTNWDIGADEFAAGAVSPKGRRRRLILQ